MVNIFGLHAPLILSFCLLLSTLSLAQDGAPQSEGVSNQVLESESRTPAVLFREGVAAFNAGDLGRARGLLEQAQAQGLRSASLRYNLGVLYYNLELWPLSRLQFTALIDTPHRDLALYNLGLVADAEGRESDALTYFRQVAEEAEQEKLQKLARMQLAQRRTVETRRRSVAYLSLTSGYEDNLALLPDTTAANLSDAFSEALAFGRGALWHPAKEGTGSLELSGSLYRRHYYDETNFSNDAARMGLHWVAPHSSGTWRAGLLQAYYRTGGESREWRSSVDMDYRKAGCGFAGGRCELGLTVSQVEPFEGYDAYQGLHSLAKVGYRARSGNWQGDVRYRYEFNDREDLKQGSQFVSLSPQRHQLTLGGRYRGVPRLTFGGDLDYRYSTYPDAYRLAENSGAESGHRTDHRYRVALVAEYVLSRHWTLVGEGAHIVNESSLDQYEYQNQIYELGMAYLF